MGVRGLTSYIRQKKDMYLCEYRLHDTKLIIDGSNLKYFLYDRFQESSNFGGDYDQFAKVCRDFFNTLSKCNVTPIVVFDGADDPSDVKLSTLLKRMLKKLRRVERGEGVLPILSGITLRQVLVELNIAHVACLFEADREIAVLANKLRCPVLSDDSDFFVFNLDIGSISMGSLTEAVPKRIVKVTSGKSDFFLPVQLFTCRTFLKEEFKMEDDKYIFPVFATLIGNDYFDPPEMILTSPKHPCNQLYIPARYPEIIVDWIRRADFENGKEALAQILEQMCGEKKKQFQESVQSYSNIENFVFIDLECIAKRMQNRMVEQRDGNEAEICVADDQEEEEYLKSIKVADYNGNQLPDWFLTGLIKCEINCTFLLNTAVNHRFIFSSQMEMLSEQTTYTCSTDIRRLIYRIVVGPVNQNDRERQTKNSYIEEYFRETEPSLVQPVDMLPDIREIPSLANVPLMLKEDKIAILLAALESRQDSFDQTLDPASQLFLLVVRMWIKKAKPKVTEYHLTALIVSVIALHAFQLDQTTAKSTGTSRTEVPVFEDIKDALSEKKVVKFIKIQLRKHFSTPQVCVQSPGVIEVVHAFAQFQACFLHTYYLNQLLQSPVCVPSPEVILNCTFLFNFYHHLRSKEDPSKYIDSLFGTGSAIHCLLNKWKRIAMVTD